MLLVREMPSACLPISVWTCTLYKMKKQNFAVHVCGGANNRREEKRFLVVSVLLPITIDLALRSNTQRRI